MRKLLLFTFTMALLSMLSVSTFAQWGKTVTVANDTELIQAMDNGTIEVINLEPGYYEYLGQLIQDNSFTKMIRAEGSTRQDCDYFIQVANFCEGDFVVTQVFTSGVSCPMPDMGYWSVIAQVGGSTIDLRENVFPFASITPGPPGPHPYIIQFEADLPGEYVLRYDFPDGQFVQGNYYVREIPMLSVSEVDPVCEDECFEFVVTITRDLSLPVQSQAMPPYDLTYEVDGGGTISFQILAADEDPAGSGIYVKTLEFCDWDCGDYEFEFVLEQSNGNDCGGTSVLRDVNIYDTPVLDVQENDSICGLVYDIGASYTLDCPYPEVVTWEKVSGPGTIVFDGNEVTVSECGDYTFLYTVTNGPCEAATTVNISFYDYPEITIQDDDEVCGLEYDLDVSYVVDCAYPGLMAGWYWISGPSDDVVFTGNHVEVPECGVYEFGYYVENGPCDAASSVTISFYDEPVVDAGDDDEVCGLEYTFDPSSEYSCMHPDYMEEWSLVDGPGTAVFDGNMVTVSVCGEYEFLFTVTNGPCGPVTDLVVIDFYDEPEVEAGEDQEICGLEADLLATVTVECEHDDYTGYWGVKSPAPGGVEFDNPAGPGTGVTVTDCGEYTFVYTVENGPCGPVTDFVIVNFYDEPELIAEYADEVCGFETVVEICVDTECLHPDGITGGTWYVENGFGVDVTDDVDILMVVPVAVVECPMFSIEVPECGEYTFTYSVMNGPCMGATTFTITFYEAPEPEIFGPDEVNICREADYYLIENSDCYLVDETAVTYTWSIIPAGAGDFKDGINTGTEVTITWNIIGPATVRVDASIGELDDCTGFDEFEVDVVAPMLAGQVKYWNQFETYMPTPFPTQDYATYPHDYFYVTLGYGTWDGDEFFVVNDSITTVVVEPRLDEDLNELMSYFEFDLTEYFETWTQFENLCEGWFLKIWDGGLIYYELPGGYPINPPQAARHLGNNYTYNNWGGVNATDALAIQIMATQMDINGAPWNFTWVGPNTWLPRYGYYSHSAADVNSSNPYVNGGITALDALTTNYRAVGLLDVFPNSQVGVQYSPNFRVTGRLVPELPYMTWDMPFDYEFSAAGDPIAPTTDNPDDVPFFHSGMSYLYFTPAWVQKYTSTPISLSDKNYINIYYLASGDLNSSYVPTSTGFKAEPAMALNYDGEQVVNKGDVITVPIRIDQNAELGAISLDLSYNTSLIEVLGVDYEDDYFMIDAEAGTIRVMWFNLETPANFAFGDAIANIQVRVLGDISADTRFFELEANTELADRNAQPFKNINLETTALSSVSEGLFMTNYPNPFRETTMISYSIPEEGNVSLVVYNKLGQVVETLVSTRQDAGTYQVEFGRTDLTPGAYFYRIIVEGEANTYTSTNSMIFMQ